MALSLNLDKVFAPEKGYLHALRVRPEDDTILKSARDEIREVLRAAFVDWKPYVSQAELMEGSLAKALTDARLPRPKFRMQGSFDYHTVNDCQRTPPQQIDMDDGVFLPVGFLTDDGRIQPAIAAKAYFSIVEGALKPLCERRGWKLANPPKKTCVRVILNDRLHVDLPLYAIQNAAFVRLVEARAQVLAKAAMDAADPVSLPDDVFTGLASSEIFLAHRLDGWIGSDPRKLSDWFASAVDIYGPQIRRLARVFKGMRDHTWVDGELSSIAIMAALVKARGALGFLDPNRDDLAIVQLSRQMAIVFGATIENPVFPGEADKCLCKDWSLEFRREVQGVFNRVSEEVDQAIHGTLVKSLAISRLRRAFGDRIPDDDTLLQVMGVAAIVRQTEPQPQPRPLTPRTKSG